MIEREPLREQITRHAAKAIREGNLRRGCRLLAAMLYLRHPDRR
ncbi:MAG: hypothetical protein ACKV2U_11380 [Bryobacteraceae bacterium]